MKNKQRIAQVSARAAQSVIVAEVAIAEPAEFFKVNPFRC